MNLLLAEKSGLQSPAETPEAADLRAMGDRFAKEAMESCLTK